MHRSLTVLLVLLCALPSAAAVVPMDLLGGLGDFDYCGDVAWNVYGHPDYDFEAQSGWVADFRSTVAAKTNVTRRLGGAGLGDTVTIKVADSSGSTVVERVYEFTDGGGARVGNTQVNLGSDPSPANAAAKLRDAVDSQQRLGVTVTASGGTVYLKPRLHWEINALSDSDAVNTRLSTQLSTWRSGFDPCMPDDSVAVGWYRQNGSTVDPARNTVYRLASGGIVGTNCQYFGIKDYVGSSGYAFLSTSIPVKNKTSNPHVGDSVTFRVDYLRMSGYDGLPAGANASYKIGLKWGASRVEQPIPASGTATSAELSGIVPAGTTDVTGYLRTDVGGDMTGREVGMYVDGAHLFVKRAGSADYATWEIPAPRNRSIRTMRLLCKPAKDDDIYELARDYDILMFGEEYGKYIPLLKRVHPGLQVYLYQTSTITDNRDDRGVDAWWSQGPVQMSYALRHHPEWLYADGVGGYLRPPWYPQQPYAHLDDAGYEALWAATARDRAGKWRFDGVWIDDLLERALEMDGSRIIHPEIRPWEIQRFIQAVAPVLESGGILAVVNSGCRFLESGAGQAYYDPFWAPTAVYPAPDYRANSVATTPNGFQNEWTFWKLRMGTSFYTSNSYDKDYWLRCIRDMDVVKRWNTATGTRQLDPSDRRYYHTVAVGIDLPTDPAQGPDGWLRYGLCSYFLGQNDWTSFAWGTRETFDAALDLSITKRLGNPAGDHAAYNGDNYMRYRNYAPTADGVGGGVVVVNGHHDVSATYSVPFSAVDEIGTPLPAGTVIALKPHTGRILLKPAANIEVVVGVSTQDVTPGQTVSVAVDYLNTSSEDAESVIVRAMVPRGMSYVPGSAEASGGSFDSASNVVSWPVGTVLAHGSGTRNFSVRVE